MAELELLAKQRDRVKAKFTAFNNFIIRVDIAPEYKEELPLRIEKAESLLAYESLLEYDTIQGKIEVILDDTEAQAIEWQDFENKYYKLITAAQKLQMNERAPPSQAYQ